MRILALETATSIASAAVVEDASVLAETVMRAPMRHLEWLLPAVHEMLEALQTGPETIGGLAVSCGPGGFTGLRIGIATAAGWAKVGDLPVLGVGTLEALAHVPGATGLVLAVLDAHRGEVAGALYRVGGAGEAECVVAATVARPEALAAQVAPHSGPLLVVGDGLEKYGDAIAAALGSRARLGGPHLHPRAAVVGLLAAPRLAGGERTAPDDLRPRYGRRPVP